MLSGTQSHTAKNLFHIARTFAFLCAASIVSCDFHSETSTIVPSRARTIVGARSVTRPSLRKVLCLSGLGPISHDYNNTVHKSDIMLAIVRQGKQFDLLKEELRPRARFRLTQQLRRARNAS